MLYKIYRPLSLALSILAVTVCFLAPKQGGYESIWLLPLVFFLLNSISNIRLKGLLQTRPVLILINFFLLIKYSVTPLLVVVTRDFSAATFTGTTPHPDSIQFAVVLSLIEMLGIFLVIYIFAPILYKKSNLQESGKNLLGAVRIHFNSVLVFFMIFAGAMAVLFGNFFIPGSLLFLSEDYAGVSANTGLDGLALMMAQAMKLIIAGLIINEMLYRYRLSPKLRYVLGSYAVILTYVVLSTGTSRTGVLIPFLIFILLTQPIFKKKGLTALLIVTPVIIASLISISAFKASWLVNDSNSSQSVAVAGVISGQIQEYTANLRPTALGIEAIDKGYVNTSPVLFFNDIVGSIPLVNTIVDQSDRINVYYNDYVLGLGTDNTSQIMPMSTISQAYFGVIGAWLLPALCVVLAMIIDTRKVKSTFSERYLQVYLIYIFVFGIFSNTQMIVGRYFTVYLPAFIVLYLLLKFNNTRISKRGAVER